MHFLKKRGSFVIILDQSQKMNLFFDKFARMYASLQYGVLTANKKGKPNIDKEFELEKGMKGLFTNPTKSHLAIGSVDKARALLHKIGRIRTKKNYYLTNNEYDECSVHLVDESESEAEHIQQQILSMIRKFLIKNNPNIMSLKAFPATVDEKSLVPHFSHHVGSNRNQYIECAAADCNVSQPASKNYSRDKRLCERIFNNEARTDLKSYKDLINIGSIKKFGFWQVLLLRGEQPKVMRGHLFGSGKELYFYNITLNDTYQLYKINAGTVLLNRT